MYRHIYYIAPLFMFMLLQTVAYHYPLHNRLKTTHHGMSIITANDQYGLLAAIASSATLGIQLEKSTKIGKILSGINHI